MAVIVHHGTAGGGHYTCYALNEPSSQWMEFDDSSARPVSVETVANCQAYVLFYQKRRTSEMEDFRRHIANLTQQELEARSSKPSIRMFSNEAWYVILNLSRWRSLAVLHFVQVVLQIQDVCWTRAYTQSRFFVSSWRHSTVENRKIWWSLFTSQCCCLGSFAYEVIIIKRKLSSRAKNEWNFVYAADLVAVPLAIDFLGAQFVNRSKKWWIKDEEKSWTLFSSCREIFKMKSPPFLFMPLLWIGFASGKILSRIETPHYPARWKIYRLLFYGTVTGS